MCTQCGRDMETVSTQVERQEAEALARKTSIDARRRSTLDHELRIVRSPSGSLYQSNPQSQSYIRIGSVGSVGSAGTEFPKSRSGRTSQTEASQNTPRLRNYDKPDASLDQGLNLENPVIGHPTEARRRSSIADYLTNKVSNITNFLRKGSKDTTGGEGPASQATAHSPQLGLKRATSAHSLNLESVSECESEPILAVPSSGPLRHPATLRKSPSGQIFAPRSLPSSPEIRRRSLNQTPASTYRTYNNTEVFQAEQDHSPFGSPVGLRRTPPTTSLSMRKQPSTGLNHKSSLVEDTVEESGETNTDITLTGKVVMSGLPSSSITDKMFTDDTKMGGSVDTATQPRTTQSPMLSELLAPETLPTMNQEPTLLPPSASVTSSQSSLPIPQVDVDMGRVSPMSDSEYVLVGEEGNTRPSSPENTSAVGVVSDMHASAADTQNATNDTISSEVNVDLLPTTFVTSGENCNTTEISIAEGPVDHVSSAAPSPIECPPSEHTDTAPESKPPVPAVSQPDPQSPPAKPESPPPQPEQPPLPPAQPDMPLQQPEQPESPPPQPEQPESPPPQPEQPELPPPQPEQPESIPPQPEPIPLQPESPPPQPESPPPQPESPPPQPESPPRQHQQRESSPPQPEQPDSIPLQPESPPTQPERLKSPPSQPDTRQPPEFSSPPPSASPSISSTSVDGPVDVEHEGHTHPAFEEPSALSQQVTVHESQQEEGVLAYGEGRVGCEAQNLPTCESIISGGIDTSTYANAVEGNTRHAVSTKGAGPECEVPSADGTEPPDEHLHTLSTDNSQPEPQPTTTPAEDYNNVSESPHTTHTDTPTTNTTTTNDQSDEQAHISPVPAISVHRASPEHFNPLYAPDNTTTQPPLGDATDIPPITSTPTSNSPPTTTTTTPPTSQSAKTTTTPPFSNHSPPGEWNGNKSLSYTIIPPMHSSKSGTPSRRASSPGLSNQTSQPGTPVTKHASHVIREKIESLFSSQQQGATASSPTPREPLRRTLSNTSVQQLVEQHESYVEGASGRNTPSNGLSTPSTPSTTRSGSRRASSGGSIQGTPLADGVTGSSGRVSVPTTPLRAASVSSERGIIGDGNDNTTPPAGFVESVRTSFESLLTPSPEPTPPPPPAPKRPLSTSMSLLPSAPPINEEPEDPTDLEIQVITGNINLPSQEFSQQFTTTITDLPTTENDTADIPPPIDVSGTGDDMFVLDGSGGALSGQRVEPSPLSGQGIESTELVPISGSVAISGAPATPIFAKLPSGVESTTSTHTSKLASPSAGVAALVPVIPSQSDGADTNVTMTTGISSSSSLLPLNTTTVNTQPNADSTPSTLNTALTSAKPSSSVKFNPATTHIPIPASPESTSRPESPTSITILNSLPQNRPVFLRSRSCPDGFYINMERPATPDAGDVRNGEMGVPEPHKLHVEFEESQKPEYNPAKAMRSHIDKMSAAAETGNLDRFSEMVKTRYKPVRKQPAAVPDIERPRPKFTDLHLQLQSDRFDEIVTKRNKQLAEVQIQKTKNNFCDSLLDEELEDWEPEPAPVRSVSTPPMDGGCVPSSCVAAAAEPVYTVVPAVGTASAQPPGPKVIFHILMNARYYTTQTGHTGVTNRVCFRLPAHRPLRVLMEAFTKRANLTYPDLTNHSFMYCGRPLDPSKTPSDYGIEKGATIVFYPGCPVVQAV